MSHDPDALPSITPADLDAVTGGVTARAGDASTQTSAALQSIMSSLKDLGSTTNNAGNSLTQLLPMLLLMKGGGGGGCGCGCGMAGCRR